MIKDIADLLRRWDVWKRVEAAPDRLDALEKRVAALEAAAAAPPGARCPSCTALAYRVVKSAPTTGPFRHLGGNERTYRCSACAFSETKLDV